MRDMWLLLVLLPVTVLVLRGGRGTLTEHVVAHPTTLSPFPQVFFMTGRS